MNYFLKAEVKPVQVDNGLSLHQRYQSMRYRAKPEIAVARREVAYGVNPFASGFNEVG